MITKRRISKVGRFRKRRKTGGRQKGTPNKLTTSFKQAVILAFDAIGGDRTFQRWAKKNQTAFYKIATRLIPTEVVGDPDRPVAIKVTFGGRYKPDGTP
jgi:hypothetical protein